DATAQPSEAPVLHFGGCGGVFLLAESGELWIEVEKYDLNVRGVRFFCGQFWRGRTGQCWRRRRFRRTGLVRATARDRCSRCG
ncbi:MAG TPA: hypothetical protein PLC40_07785, partial [Candidatus Hydrogenedentes bacterium]|nr:hypothetical protein [Candidatus Hydrogenedentota bacterium]